MANYSAEDKQAFKEKDERISRTAAFNNIVALRIAEVELTKDTSRLTFESIADEIDSVVFNYLWSGERVNSKPVEKPKRGRPKKKDDAPVLPECNDQQAEVLEAIHKELDSDMSMNDLKAKIIEKYGRYPGNMNSVQKVVEDITNG